MVELFGLAGVPLSECPEFITERQKSALTVFSYYDYNVEYFLSKSDDEIEDLIANHTPYYLDSIFCGLEPYDSRYDRQVAENQAAALNER